MTFQDPPNRFPPSPGRGYTVGDYQHTGGKGRTQGPDSGQMMPAGMDVRIPSQAIQHPEQALNAGDIDFHGEALAVDPWLSKSAGRIVLGFTALFACIILLLQALGNKPGELNPLKDLSDVFQFLGEAIGLFFCARITLRLVRVSRSLQDNLNIMLTSRNGPRPELVNIARNEANAARRAALAWGLLTIGILFYASGQAAWTSYDVRMNSFEVPFPGLYDIGFVGAYPFFLIGTLLLTRRNRSAIGRVRLLLDALAVLGSALLLSWFFVLGPTISSLAGSFGAEFLSIYFPAGDLFLVAVGAFMMFSPLSSRERQPVFLRLCLGLFILAVTDSLLIYFTLTSGFNTGTLQDLLWPLSMSFIGLAAVEYPHSVRMEQLQEARTANPTLATSQLMARGQTSQLTATLQTIAPFVVSIGTCAILLIVVAPQGGAVLLQSEVLALLLVIIVAVRQGLTLIDNQRLSAQLRGDLLTSKRRQQIAEREAEQGAQAAEQKRILEQGIQVIQEVHSQIARGEWNARANITGGPLLPLATSLNLMLDRVAARSRDMIPAEQILQERDLLQAAIQRILKGAPLLAPEQTRLPSNLQLGAVLIGLNEVQRHYDTQWKKIATSLEGLKPYLARLKPRLQALFAETDFMVESERNKYQQFLGEAGRVIDALEQYLRSAIEQSSGPGLRRGQPPGSDSTY
jgi:hypothetical protein